MDLDYYTSERFIHDNLIREAEAGLHIISDWWWRERRVPPFLITWPKDTVHCDDGSKVEDKFFFDLPDDPSSWKDLVELAAKKTKAYALLLATQRENEVRVVFESRHGTKSWHFAITRHGPDKILEDPNSKTDECSVGLLWKP